MSFGPEYRFWTQSKLTCRHEFRGKASAAFTYGRCDSWRFDLCYYCSLRAALTCSLDQCIIFDRTSSEFRNVIPLPISIQHFYYLDTNGRWVDIDSPLTAVCYIFNRGFLLDLLESH